MGDPAPDPHASEQVSPPPRCAACGEVMTQVGSDFQCLRCSSPQIPSPDAPTRKAAVPVCPICGVEMTLVRVGQKLDFHCLRCTTARDTRASPTAPPLQAGGATAPACPVCKAPMTAIETGGSKRFECLKCTTFKDTRSAGTRRQARTEDVLPEDVRKAGENPANLFGDYIFVCELGKGGMGAVHKAWDSKLGRWVAIKLLRGDDPSDLERFIREAKMSAGLVHPNIVAVYEAGAFDGKHFISMQLVEGESLNRLRLTEKEAAQAVHEAAVAVHFANERGVIHRDLKPHNIMMSKDRHVFVMDFGLARSAQASGQHVTLAGTILGTPAFMAPEQALCKEALDGRADVYGLGATLYHLLTGSPPFEAPSLGELLGKVVYAQPDSPAKHNKKVDRDLDTIVLKCLEKDPKSRYGTAGELAEDLERYINGEPILARPLMPGVRLVRKLQRHPVALSIAAALILALGVTGVFAFRWYQDKKAKEQEADDARRREAQNKKKRDEEVARLKQQELEKALRLQKAKDEFGPAGDEIIKIREALKEGRRQDVEKPLEAIAEYQRRAELEDDSFKEGWIKIAQFRRLMGDGAKAREALEKAPNDLRANLERGLMFAADYGAERARAVQKWNQKEDDLIRQGQLAARRVYTEEDLRQIDEKLGPLRDDAFRELDVAGKGLVGDTSDVVQCGLARLEFFDGKFAAAESLLDKNNEPDAHLIRAEIEERQGHPEKARAAYDRALTLFPSYVEPRLALGRLLRSRVDDERWNPDRQIPLKAVEESIAYWKGQPEWIPDQKRARAELYLWKGNFQWDRMRLPPAESYDAALKESGDDPEIRGRVALGRVRWARRSGAGGDPRSLLAQARTDLEAAGLQDLIGEVWLEQAGYEDSRGEDPRKSYSAAIDVVKQRSDVGAIVLRARLHADLGRWLVQHSQDPNPEYDLGMEAAAEALKIQKDDPDALQLKGRLLLRRAEWGAAHEKDPAGPCGEALACFDDALRRRSGDAGLHADRAAALTQRAAWKARHGVDPTTDLNLAGDAYDLSIRLAADAERLTDLGEARALEADWAAFGGNDPTKKLKEAARAFDEALKKNPDLARARSGLGRAWEQIAGWQTSHGEDPREASAEAERNLTEAMKVKGDDAQAILFQGTVRRRAADLAAQRFDDPTALYDDAIKTVRDAFGKNKNLAQARAEESAALAGRADWRAGHGLDPTDDLTTAREILKDLPADPEILYRWGLAARRLAEWKSSRGVDPSADLDETIDRFAKANEATSQKDARVWSAIGGAHLLRGSWLASMGGDPAAALGDAERALKRAVDLKGRDPASARRDLGLVHDRRARWQESRGIDPQAEYDAAVREFREARTVNASMTDVATLGGMTQLAKARWRTRHGLEPDAADAVGEGAVNPKDPEALRLSTRGLVARGEGDAAVGRDPSAVYGKALDAAAAGAAIDAENPATHFLRGLAHLRRAEFNARYGREVAADLSEAEAAFGEATRRHARFAEACRERGRVHFVRATLTLSSGKDPTADVGSALECFKAAIGIDPSYAEALAARAEALELQARWLIATGENPGAPLTQAIQAADASLAINGDDPRTHAIRGAAYDRRAVSTQSDDDFSKAVESYNRATKGNPRDAASWTALGLAFLHQKDGAKDAVAAFRGATAINATDPQILQLQGLASLYSAEEEFKARRDPRKLLDAAEASYRKAVEANPNLADAWNGLGEAALKRADWGLAPGPAAAEELRHAVEYCTKAIGLNGRYVNALLTRGDAHTLLGEADAALKDYETAQAANPKALDASMKRALALARAGRRDEAAASMKALADAHPDRADFWFNLGVIYQGWAAAEAEAGKSPVELCGRAVESFDKAIRADPKPAEPYRWRGDAKLARGEAMMGQQQWAAAETELMGAYNDFSDALTRNASDTDARESQIWAGLDLGKTVLRRGGKGGEWYEKALGCSDRALEANAQSANFHYLRGLCLQALGKNKDAAEERRKALQIDPNHEGAKRDLPSDD